jgi:hypothetical protein
MPTLQESSSATTAYTTPSSPHRPRKLFKHANDDKTTYRSAPVTTRYARPQPVATIAETPPQWGQGPIHSAPAPPFVAAIVAAPPQWGHALFISNRLLLPHGKLSNGLTNNHTVPNQNLNRGLLSLPTLPRIQIRKTTSFPCPRMFRLAPLSKSALP